MLYSFYSILLLALLNNPVPKVVVEFHQLQTQDDELKFIEKYSSSKSTTELPYLYAIQMKQAEYSYNPYTKLSLFSANKNSLDSLLKVDPSNIHAYYIRVITQQKLPSMLINSDQLEADKEYLRNALDKKDETDYMDPYIRKYCKL